LNSRTTFFRAAVSARCRENSVTVLRMAPAVLQTGHRCVAVGLNSSRRSHPASIPFACRAPCHPPCAPPSFPAPS
jgi:hypothetical protein